MKIRDKVPGMLYLLSLKQFNIHPLYYSIGRIFCIIFDN